MNWTRANLQSMDLASDLARRVLPTPGKSSTMTWPPANRATTQARMTSSLPRITDPMAVAIWPARSATVHASPRPGGRAVRRDRSLPNPWRGEPHRGARALRGPLRRLWPAARSATRPSAYTAVG